VKPLLMDELLKDGRVEQARKLLLQSVQEHQRGLTGVRPADGERKVSYEQLIKEFNQARGGNLYYPYLGAGLGNGPLVELADGSVKFDFISGIGVHHFGHSHPRLIAAGFEAALRDTVMQGNLEQNVESVSLAAGLVERAAPGSQIAHAFMTTSGAMANENAIKLAFHKKPGSTRVLAFAHTFAGRTMALSSLTDKAAYRAGLPVALTVDYVPYFDQARPEESTKAAVAAVREYAARYPGQHAAIWCELVLGEGGFYTGSREFFAAVCAEAKKNGIFVVADEVQTFGRTSRLFGFQHFGLESVVDIVTVGKMLQVCATLFTAAIKPSPGIVSQTFTASTSAIFAANVILKELLTDELFGLEGRNMRVNARFAQHFDAINKRHPGWIRGPYGLGGMVAFTALDGTEEKAKKVLQALFEAGVIAFYNGSNPTRLRFLPPVPVVTDAHVDTVCEIVEASMAKVAGGPAA
jgi:4-aminobutyrate aminotransferase-like enzyme